MKPTTTKTDALRVHNKNQLLGYAGVKSARAQAALETTLMPLAGRLADLGATLTRTEDGPIGNRTAYLRVEAPKLPKMRLHCRQCARNGSERSCSTGDIAQIASSLHDYLACQSALAIQVRIGRSYHPSKLGLWVTPCSANRRPPPNAILDNPVVSVDTDDTAYSGKPGKESAGILDFSKFDAVLDPATLRLCAPAADIARGLGITPAAVSRNFRTARRYGKCGQYIDITDVVSARRPRRGRPHKNPARNNNQ